MNAGSRISHASQLLTAAAYRDHRYLNRGRVGPRGEIPTGLLQRGRPKFAHCRRQIDFRINRARLRHAPLAAIQRG
jgi:hypothetical protein